MTILAKFPLAKLPAIISLALGLGYGSPVLAGSVADGTPGPPPQKGVNLGSGPKAPATDEPIARLQMSSDLLAFGRDSKDPLALIVAARIMKAVGGTDVDMKPEGRAAGDSAQKSGQAVTPDSILVEARDLAKGDKLTNLLIDEAGLAGDGSSDLDLLVYDENDHLVCRSASSSDREYCRWWPRWTGPFRIEIQNLGAVANLYRVATN